MMSEIPERIDRRTRAAIERRLRLARSHPRLFALLPVANAALAVALALYSAAHLVTTFVLFLGGR
jgi:hypothetical protein